MLRGGAGAIQPLFINEDYMNLLEMRNMIGSIIDYDPQITSYKNEVNRIINEIYLQFFTERAWQWAQKDIDVYTVPDITETNKRITTGAAGQRGFENGIELMSNTADQIITFKTKDNHTHDGSILVISDADDADNNGVYIIDKIDFPNQKVRVSRMASDGQVDWAGAASTTDDGITVKAQQRYMTLPEDCHQLLSVGIRNVEEAGVGTNALGHFYPLTRRYDEELDLRFDLEGTPTNYILYDSYPENVLDVFDFTPRQGKDFKITGTSGTNNWPAGDYEFKMAYMWRGVVGKTSDAFAITLNGSQVPRFHTDDTTHLGVYGLHKVFFVRLKSITGQDGNTHQEDFFRDLSKIRNTLQPFTPYVGYFLQDESTNATWPDTDINLSTRSRLLSIPREVPNKGYRQRIRLFPRPTSQTPIKVRYIFFPREMTDDYDSPEAPYDCHRYIVYRACEELFFKHKDLTQSEFYRKKAEREYMKLENKYLTLRSGVYIKKDYVGGPMRIRPFRNLTKLPDA